MGAFPLTAVAGLLSGGISALQGLSQKKKANDLIANNPFPMQEVPQAIQQNQRLAAAYANQGLPSEQYNQAKQNIARNQVTSLQGAGDRRGGLMAIGGLNKQSNDATLGLDVANANDRRANQKQQLGINSQVGQWQNNVWDWNARQKYLQTAASARALMGAGNANLYGGLDRIAGGGLQAANAGAFNNIFGKKQGSSATSGYNPNVSYDEGGNEYYTDEYGNPIK